MKNSEEFKKRLSALLKEFDAEMSVEDFGHGYSHDHQIDLQLNSIYADNGDLIRPYESVKLGTYLD